MEQLRSNLARSWDAAGVSIRALFGVWPENQTFSHFDAEEAPDMPGMPGMMAEPSPTRQRLKHLLQLKLCRET